jgi:chaperonin cofactor prefoldin
LAEVRNGNHASAGGIGGVRPPFRSMDGGDGVRAAHPASGDEALDDVLPARLEREVGRTLQSAADVARALVDRAKSRDQAMRRETEERCRAMVKQAEHEATAILQRATSEAVQRVNGAQDEAARVLADATMQRDRVMIDLADESDRLELRIASLRREHRTLHKALEILEEAVREARAALTETVGAYRRRGGHAD